jgi:hypothetical protein
MELRRLRHFVGAHFPGLLSQGRRETLFYMPSEDWKMFLLLSMAIIDGRQADIGYNVNEIINIFDKHDSLIEKSNENSYLFLDPTLKKLCVIHRDRFTIMRSYEQGNQTKINVD